MHFQRMTCRLSFEPTSPAMVKTAPVQNHNRFEYYSFSKIIKRLRMIFPRFDEVLAGEQIKDLILTLRLQSQVNTATNNIVQRISTAGAWEMRILWNLYQFKVFIANCMPHLIKRDPCRFDLIFMRFLIFTNKKVFACNHLVDLLTCFYRKIS